VRGFSLGGYIAQNGGVLGHVGVSEGLAYELIDAVDQGLPASAVAFCERWWQLETWLRQFAYMALRAKYGTGWLQHLVLQAPTRAARDEINTYRATPDASNALAYLDVSHLFDRIGSDERAPPSRARPPTIRPAMAASPPSLGVVDRRDELGGLVDEYHRTAA
jgi:hypothetical protein